MGEEFIERRIAGSTFHRVDLTGSTFEEIYLRGARFHDVDLGGAVFREVNLTGVRVRGALVQDVEISGEIEGLTVNGVEVAPLVEAELDRRHPERVRLRPTDAEGFREAWTVIEELWAGTIQRARDVEPALLHESVDGEWSFIETLRHLVFATDAWVRRGLLGDPSPWHPLDLPWDEMPDTEGIPRDREVRPSLDEVLELRADRMGTVRRVVDEMTDERLAGETEPVPGPGWPESRSYPVSQVLGVVLNEEWWHRQFAERDLALLTSGGSPGTGA